MREQIGAGQGFLVEILNYNKSGNAFWVTLDVQAVRDDTGTLTRFIGVQIDITMRKREVAIDCPARDDARPGRVGNARSGVPQLLKVVGESLGLDRGEYWQIDPDSSVLHLTYDWSTSPEQDREFSVGSRLFTFGRGVGVPGRVWASGRPSWISKLDNHDTCTRFELAVRAGLRRRRLSDRQHGRDNRRHDVLQQDFARDRPVVRGGADDHRPADRHVHRTSPCRGQVPRDLRAIVRPPLAFPRNGRRPRLQRRRAPTAGM